MKTLDVKLIEGGKDRPWFDVFQLRVDRVTAANWFDRAPYVDWVDGLGNADYWAVEFPCGLQVAFEFLHNSSSGAVFATEPVPQHVGRHLRHWRNVLHEYSPDMFEVERTRAINRFSQAIPEWEESRCFQLWRQGDDGNPVKIGVPTSQRDAACWQAELESHKHKQIYWVSRVDGA